VPNFWFAILLVLLFAVHWRIAPAGGFPGWSAGFGRALAALILPAIALGVVQAAILTRVARSALIETLNEDFIRTARAKGLSDRVVLYKHALRNALLPVVTVLGLQFGNVLAGAILVETVFNWPGLGRLAFESVLRRDYPTILGVLLFSSVVVVVMNQLTDLCYGWIDPRIRAA
jgi:peptide/nickel transport system permease protein